MHIKALEGRILKSINQANRDFGLIGEGDRVLVALSGGKDSYGLLWGLMKLQASAVFKFDLVTYHLDQGQPGHNTAPIEAHMQQVGLPYEIEFQDTYTRVVEKTEAGKIYCSLCSRFRRAILYKAAIRHGCNKVALGHHRDDLIETLMLNVLFSGQIKAMPARLRSDAGVHEVIRPLCYVPEEHMVELAAAYNFAIVPCRLCGSQEAKRSYVKKLLNQLNETSPHIKGNILAALGNVRPSHLLDRKLNPLFAGDLDADLALAGESEVAPTTAAGPVPGRSCGVAEAAAPLVQLG
jgi:tRNA 2-thiocytidine biosynthesis protein TtcA